MINILHIVSYISQGGAVRAMLGAGAEAARFDTYHHRVIALSGAEPQGIELVQQYGFEFVPVQSYEQIHQLMAEADIVQIEWWNCPYVDAFLRSPLPACRLLVWPHVAGNRAPQMVTDQLIDFADRAIASSPLCYDQPAFQDLPPETKLHKTDMVYDCADFRRVQGSRLRAHEGFRVGYIGTVHYIKMHPSYLDMSAKVNISDVRFVVCGVGAVPEIQQQAASKGIGQKFNFLGYVENIRNEIEQFDVYGYPLCEDTYASAELNLQEVMYVGVPPVVFPYGGVEKLVIDNFTGFVVRSEAEYVQAIEYLYEYPGERARIGQNAAHYARQIFGAERAGEKFHHIYAGLMKDAKKSRTWGQRDPQRKPGSQDYFALASSGPPAFIGAQRFAESIGGDAIAPAFLVSLLSAEAEECALADEEILKSSFLLQSGGLARYSSTYPEDALLHFWNGLALLGAGKRGEAQGEFALAGSKGLQRRVPEVG